METHDTELSSSQLNQNKVGNESDTINNHIPNDREQAPINNNNKESFIYHSIEKDEVIYHQGDISTAAFVIVSGSVKLSTSFKGNEIVIARLHPNSIFGDLEILSGTPRIASAIALEKTKIRYIPADSFINVLYTNKEQLAKPVKTFIEKINSGDKNILGHLRGAAMIALQKQLIANNNKGFFNRLLSNLGGRKAHVEVLVPNLQNDSNGLLTKQLVRILRNNIENENSQNNNTITNSKKLIRFRQINNKEFDYQIDDNLKVQSIDLASMSTKVILTKHDADLILWGKVDEQNNLLEFHFLNKLDDFGLRPGTINSLHELPIATSLGENDILLLKSCICATTYSRQKDTIKLCNDVILNNIDGLKSILSSNDLKNSPKANLLNICSAIIGWYSLEFNLKSNELEQVHKAQDEALRIAKNEKNEMLIGIINRQQGEIKIKSANLKGDTKLYEDAIQNLELSLKFFTKKDTPSDWGNIHARIGDALLKIDAIKKSNDFSRVEQAIEHYKSALEVVLVSNIPIRWADIKTSYAKALMILGREERRIKNYVEAIHQLNGALKIRTKERYPLNWARIQNALAVSHFYISQQLNKKNVAIVAKNHFLQARYVYNELGNKNKVNVINKNIYKLALFLEENPIKYGINENMIMKMNNINND